MTDASIATVIQVIPQKMVINGRGMIVAQTLLSVLRTGDRGGVGSSTMRRFHFIEIEDQSWCPEAIRDGITDLLELVLRLGNYYAPAVPLLASALRETESHDVLDLCSGGGGPWLRLIGEFSDAAPSHVLLTDKFPPIALAARAESDSSGRIHAYSGSIDATAVPRELPGFRTLFSSFHHFRPDMAQAIIADAVRNRVGIGIFEFTQRSFLAAFLFSLTPIAVLLLTPFTRPFRWSRLLLTYVIPAIPLAATFDGMVSCLRTYSPSELRTMIAPFSRDRYVWKIGRVRSWRSPVAITYLIAHPAPARDAA